MKQPVRKAWIDILPTEEWTGELGSLREACTDPGTGEVDPILAVHSSNPSGLKAHLAVYRASMAGTPGLRKVDRELVAVVVSKLNGCEY